MGLQSMTDDTIDITSQLFSKTVLLFNYNNNI